MGATYKAARYFATGTVTVLGLLWSATMKTIIFSLLFGLALRETE